MDSPHLVELRDIKKAVFNDEIIVDLEQAKKLCPYKFSKTINSAEKRTQQFFYSYGLYYARLLRLIELTHVGGRTTKGLLMDADKCLRFLETVSDKDQALEFFYRLRSYMKSAVLSLDIDMSTP